MATSQIRFSNVTISELRETNELPIYGYELEPLVTLDKATKNLNDYVSNLQQFVTDAMNRFKDSDEQKLNELAAIYLYTMSTPFFDKLKETLRAENRSDLKPWLPFLKLFLTALENLPSVEIKVWRGVVNGDVSDFKNNSEEIWWSVNSCSKDADLVGRCIDQNGILLCIQTFHGRDISAYSANQNESEVILMPGSRLHIRTQPSYFEYNHFLVHLNEKCDQKSSPDERISEEEATMSILDIAKRHKVALVIGNNQYSTNQLPHCVNDAVDISNTLRKISFNVSTHINLTSASMEEEMVKFVASIERGSVVLFYYAGHQAQLNDENYMIGCDDNEIRETDLNSRCVNIQKFLERLSDKDPFIIIYLLDCCHKYCLPYQSIRIPSNNSPKGLSSIKPCDWSIVAVVSQPNTVIESNTINERNGLFSFYLLQHLIIPDIKIRQVMVNVMTEIINETKNAQMPYVTSALRGRNICLVTSENREALFRILLPNTTDSSDRQGNAESTEIKPGQKFGGSGGDAFNDWLTTGLTEAYYLRGMRMGSQTGPIEWCQFLYSCQNDSDGILESAVHGKYQPTGGSFEFRIDPDDRVNKVQVLVNSSTLFINGERKRVPLVQGIRLFTINGHSSQCLEHLGGEFFTEELDGHVVGYVTGRSGRFVDQIQLFWYPLDIQQR